MQTLDPHVLIDQGCGEFFGEAVEGEDCFVAEVCEDLVTPEEDVGGGGGLIHWGAGLGVVFVDVAEVLDGVEELVVSQEDCEGQVAADDVGDVGFEPGGILIVDDVGDDDDQGSFAAVAVQVTEGFVEAAFGEPGVDVVDGVDHAVELPAASGGRDPAED